MSFEAQVSDINSSTGLAIWANGYAGTCNGLAVGSNGLTININNGTGNHLFRISIIINILIVWYIQQ